MSTRGRGLVMLLAAVWMAAGSSAQICGDCNQDGGLSILDGLRQAQIAVGGVAWSPPDLLTCDIDADEDVDIIDALKTAQVSAGLSAVLVCPAAPVVSSVTTLTGVTAGSDRVPIAGGETVEVLGFGFLGGSTVTIGTATVPAAVSDPATLTFVAPPQSGDSVFDVTVTSPGGLQGTLVAGLTYTQEYSLDPYTGPFLRSHAHHLYRRAAFAGSPAEIDAAVLAGLTATINTLVDYTNDPVVEADALTIYGGTVPPRPSLNDRTNKEWWLHMMVKNPNPFQERLAWFLHDHFAISERIFSSEARWMMFPYVNLMRRFSTATSDSLGGGEPGLGYDWRRMLEEMTKDQAMLEWLNGRTSTSTQPNENYARELWELFSLGEGHGYTENDIREAAKAFTGFFWYYSGGSGTTTPLVMRYRPSRHHTGIKTIFGIPGRFGYDDLSPMYEIDPGPSGMPELGMTDPLITTDPVDLDGGVVALTLQERPIEASRFICGKLCEFFLYENPSDVVVDALAAQLRAPGPMQWNLKPIIETILGSKAMFSEAAIKTKIDEPVDYVVGILRATGMDLSTSLTTNASRIRAELVTLGQVVLDPPDVAGWPHGTTWITTQGMLQRFNFLTYTVEQQDAISQILPLTPSPRASITPASLVDHIAEMLDCELTPTTRQACIDYVTTDYVGGVVVPLAFDPMNDNHLKIKVRGLIWLIGQHHESHLN